VRRMRGSVPPDLGRRSAMALGFAVLMGLAWTAGSYQAQQDHEQRRAAAPEALEALEELVEGSGATARSEQEAAGVGWDLPNLDHPRVDYWVRRFTTDKRGEFSRFLSRSGRYVPMISEKLTERGMPQDLIYLAMIESGFNPRAYSHAHASGLWQFIPETGRRYGLTVNNVVDERNDPVRSTDAALDYLTYLHRRFGSWYLAAAGYNTGENRVGRIMRQVTGSERGTEESYYRIWNRLPRETRDYVPLMIAAARIAKDPVRYGFEEVRLEEPLAFDEILAEPGVTLAAIARAAGADEAAVRRLNPHYKTGRTPTDRSVVVRIPSGSRVRFAQQWPAVRAEVRTAAARAPAAGRQAPASTPRAAPSRTHRVRSGETLTSIARRHGVSIAALRQANQLRGDRIRAGQTLRIPATGSAPRIARSHRVQRGENLTVIARRHGVTVQSLRQANQIRNDRIIAGQTLRIPAR
jgi:membrane-bound lytic murein transglycosylase D